jgi:hypothetical protein
MLFRISGWFISSMAILSVSGCSLLVDCEQWEQRQVSVNKCVRYESGSGICASYAMVTETQSVCVRMRSADTSSSKPSSGSVTTAAQSEKEVRQVRESAQRIGLPNLQTYQQSVFALAKGAKLQYEPVTIHYTKPGEPVYMGKILGPAVEKSMSGAEAARRYTVYMSSLPTHSLSVDAYVLKDSQAVAVVQAALREQIQIEKSLDKKEYNHLEQEFSEAAAKMGLDKVFVQNFESDHSGSGSYSRLRTIYVFYKNYFIRINELREYKRQRGNIIDYSNMAQGKYFDPPQAIDVNKVIAATAQAFVGVN